MFILFITVTAHFATQAERGMPPPSQAFSLTYSMVCMIFLAHACLTGLFSLHIFHHFAHDKKWFFDHWLHEELDFESNSMHQDSCQGKELT